MPAHTFKNIFTTNFEYIKANLPKTHSFTVIYTHGLCSAPWGLKPEAIKSFCVERGLGFLRYELVGHGSDVANYEKTNINIWKEQLLELIDDMVSGPILLVGTSMGGWLSLLGAELRQDRVIGVVGISSAPDFTVGLEDFYLTEQQKQELQEKDRIEFVTKDFTYTFTSALLKSGRDNQMLNRKINIKCPVHLLQGMKDAAYPWKYSLQIVDCLNEDNVTLKLLKNANHRMQEPEDLKEICRSLESFL